MPTRFSLRAANGQEYPVNGPFRIGREPECQIQIDNDLISRIHASVWIDHDHLLLRDERSRNGTQLNGQPLSPGEAHYLHHDDEVRVGDTVLTVVSDPPYPRPRQHRGLPGLEEDEPPPTARVEQQSPAAPAASAPPPTPPAALPQAAGSAVRATGEAPMPPANGGAAPRAVPPLPPPAPAQRSRTLPLVIGGCLLLALIVACCLGGFVLVVKLGPRFAPTPRPASALVCPRPAARQPACSEAPLRQDTASLRLASWPPQTARAPAATSTTQTDVW